MSGRVSPQPIDASSPAAGRPIILRASASAALVVVVVLSVYWPALRARGLWLDDPHYVTDNSLVLNPSWNSARRFLTEVLSPSTVHGYYHPLAMISLMLDAAAGGGADNLLPFRRTNLLLHACNAAMVALVLARLFGRPLIGAAAGAIFGLQPFAVESVVWIAERKTLLAAFFGLLFLLVHVEQARRPRRWLYAASLAALLLALLSKPISVTLPLLALVLDYWPLRRLNIRRVVRLAPHFVLAGVFAVITFVSQRAAGGLDLHADRPPGFAVAVLAYNAVFYLYRVVWPAGVAWYYPVPDSLGLTSAMGIGAVACTAAMAAVAVMTLRRTRAVFAAALLFYVALLPAMNAIGFTTAIAANRFAYLPSVGLILLGAWAAGRLTESAEAAPRVAATARFRQSCVAAALLALIAVNAALSRRYLADWEDTGSLSAAALAQAPTSAATLNFRGNWLLGEKRFDEAVRLYRRALELRPGYSQGQFNLGNALLQAGRPREAIDWFRRSIPGLPPTVYEPWYGLAQALRLIGQGEAALAALDEALRRRPDDPDLHFELAETLHALGRTGEAIAEAQRAVHRRPSDPRFRSVLGTWLVVSGRTAEAMPHLEHAKQLQPNEPANRVNLANALLMAGELDRALREYEAAFAIDPENFGAQIGAGVAELRRGRPDAAAERFGAAIRLRPESALAHQNLADALLASQRFDEAIVHYQRAAQIDARNADALVGLARALRGSGRNADAIGALRAALAIQADHAEAERMLRKLESEPAP